MPLWETCHLCFADNGEESNENKRAALCCTFPCLKGIWLANDINTSIGTRSLEIKEVRKTSRVCGEEKLHSCSTVVLFQRLTQSADVELAESDVSTDDRTGQISCGVQTSTLACAETLRFTTCCKGCGGPTAMGLFLGGLMPSSCDR